MVEGNSNRGCRDQIHRGKTRENMDLGESLIADLQSLKLHQDFKKEIAIRL